VLLLAVSCSQKEVDAVGYVSFSESIGREVLASITYVDANSLTWNVSAVKTSNGSRVGEGDYENVILTETIGAFSIGTWEFSFKGYDGTKLIYSGTTTAHIAEGDNVVEVTVNPVGYIGKWEFVDCHFSDYGLSTFGQTIYSVSVYVDDQLAHTYASTAVVPRGDGLYAFQSQLQKSADVGVHTFRVVFTGNNGKTITAETFKARVVAGMVTSISFGTFEGHAELVIVVNEETPIVEE